MRIDDFQKTISINFVDDPILFCQKRINFEDLGAYVAKTEFGLANTIDEKLVHK